MSVGNQTLVGTSTKFMEALKKETLTVHIHMIYVKVQQHATAATYFQEQ